MADSLNDGSARNRRAWTNAELRSVMDEQNRKPSMGGVWMVQMMDVKRVQISCWMNEMRRKAAVPDNRRLDASAAAHFILPI